MNRKNTGTKTRILEAAWHLLEERQGKGVRMSDIAKIAGISRQALYLHFPTRTELMIATIFYVDEVKGLNSRLESLKSARTGTELIEASVEIWGNYIPEIYGLAKAFLMTRETDEAASAAWNNIMSCLKDVIKDIVVVLDKEGTLAKAWSVEEAIGIYYSLFSILNWEQLVLEAGWKQDEYISRMKKLLKRTLMS